MVKKLEDIYPLSPIQSGMLFQKLYYEKSDVYVVQSIFEIEGDLLISNFKKAWQEVIRNHPVLRTGIIWEDLEEPLQYILQDLNLVFVEYDWQLNSKDEIKEKLSSLMSEDRTKGFELNKPPLFRLYIVYLANNKYYLIWSRHHILIDGWSSAIVINQVFQVYQAILNQQEYNFPKSSSYKDYIKFLKYQDLLKEKKFWKYYFKDFLPSTEFFSNICEKDVLEYGSFSLKISSDDLGRYQKVARKYNLTINTLFQGAIGLILYKYLNNKYLSLGVTVSGRGVPLLNINNMVGLFINTLPLLIKINNTNINTLEFLKDLQGKMQLLNEYSFSSLAKIQQWSGLNKRLFDVVLVFQNYPFSNDLSNLSEQLKIRYFAGLEKSEYPLTISVLVKEEVALDFHYQSKFFNNELIISMATYVKNILDYFADNIDKNLDFLLMSEEESDKVLIEWNATEREYPRDKTVVELFEEQVFKNPNNVAVVYG
ncbi:MAG TPA: condensation domain-containing protein, partial [Candidatus Megaira endosymbiont of Mesostigma viride]|nr:condensation domain-containing protein [Candidatus Megaira endosymbiont of Mesostigma viride]